MDLAGKVALITGGASGLGKAYAEALLRRGGKVSLADIDVKVGFKTAEVFNKTFGPGSAVFILCDVTSQSNFESAFLKTLEIYKKVDILVNNAGIMGEHIWRAIININLTGVVHGCMLALKYMGRETGGTPAVIVNISSVAGLEPFWNFPVYSASKHAVVGYSRSLADSIQYMPDAPSIRMVCLCPTIARTNIHITGKTDPELLQHFYATVKLLEPEDVSRAFMRLLDDQNNNGAVMLVSERGMRYKHPRQLQAKGKL